jgi:N-carbamoylputrescine amidase
MKIALIQQAASPDRDANVEKGLANLEKAVAQGAEVICFAELAFTPFYPQEEARGDVSHLAEPIPGPTTAAFAAAATHHGAVVVLNLFERDGESTYDSSPVINTDGSILARPA